MKLRLGLLTLLIAFTGTAYAEAMETVTGRVFYRERMTLPPDAEITVTLEDVSKMDVAADVIAATTFSAVGGPPWGFAMEYESAKIDSRHRYAVRARIEVNGQLMFTNTTQIPAFADVEGGPVEILVSRVGGSRGGQRPAAATPDASLINTYWKLVELDGQPAAPGAAGQELHIVLTSEENRVRGFSGCNRFTGGYELNGDQLHFKGLASTMMACVEEMEQEQHFLKLLGETMRFTLSGDSLALYSGDERQTLRFEAVALK